MVGFEAARDALKALGLLSFIWLVLAAAGSVVVFTAIRIVRASTPAEFWRAWLGAQPFAFAGLAIGAIAGYSRTPMMGTLLPAVITLVGGLGAALVSGERAMRLLAAMAVPAIAAALFLGTNVGTVARDTALHKQEQAAEEAQLEKMQRRMRWLAEEELRTRLFRQALELPELDTTAVIEMLKSPPAPGPQVGN